jgi:hypothetical protein
MKKFALNLRSIAAAALVTVGSLAASTAMAAPVYSFTVNPTAYSPTLAPFSAVQMSGSSSAQLTKTGDFTYTGIGYIQYSAFTSAANGSIDADETGLGVNYNLYATFTQTFVCNGALGSEVSPGKTAECGIATIDLTLFLDPFSGGKTKFTPNSTTSAYTITGNTGDIALGTVTQAYAGYASVNPLAGAAENINSNFILSADGMSFFVEPKPFYSFAYSAFTNSTGGLSCLGGTGALNCINANVVAINQETGTTEFLGATQVPEPASLALFGIALAGVASMSRRRKS